MAKILIVDDEADKRTVLFHSLQTAGHQVTEAADGEQALKKIKRTNFDLVLLDIMMPRMNVRWTMVLVSGLTPIKSPYQSMSLEAAV